ncbi:hypothetical protein Cde04nite_31140 [Cellulomonas denverensis]|nr:hypothetical protein Cde04nite_31140 [Cellulomonas denverensis]
MRRSVSSETGWPEPVRQVASCGVVVLMLSPRVWCDALIVRARRDPRAGHLQLRGELRHEPGRPTQAGPNRLRAIHRHQTASDLGLHPTG